MTSLEVPRAVMFVQRSIQFVFEYILLLHLQYLLMLFSADSSRSSTNFTELAVSDFTNVPNFENNITGFFVSNVELEKGTSVTLSGFEFQYPQFASNLS
jgi:hypothetical protein